MFGTSTVTAPVVTDVSPTAGLAAGDTIVMIAGTGFSGATAVDFGGTAATDVAINSAGTQITATSPAGTGTVDVTVTTPGGTSATSSADQFTYVAATAVPTVTGVSPALGPAAGGTTVAITGTNFTGTTAVDFGTTAASSFTVYSNTQIAAICPAELAGTVDVTVVTPAGTSSVSAADEFRYEGTPMVIGVSPSSGPPAGGTTLTITGTGFTGATAVDFGATAASSFTVNSDTQITATDPAGSGTVDVTVVTPGGSSSTSSANQFAYVGASKNELTASNGTKYDAFGESVSISGNTMVVGAPYATPGSVGNGAAYVFTQSAAGWTQVAELTTSDVTREFGYSVSISGNTVVVGAPIAGNAYQGAAYVFVEPASGWANMTQTAELTATDEAPYGDFGSSVSINQSGSTVVVGAFDNTIPYGGIGGPGAAYVFAEPASGWASMTQTAKLTASDGAAGDDFGFSVSINGNMVVVGAMGANSSQGAAYVFTGSASGWASMTQTAELTPSDGTADDHFGYSVSISDNTVAVGAPFTGAAYVFTEPASGWANMTQPATLTESGGFGASVSLSGNTLAEGAGGANSAYAFTESGGDWTRTATLTQSNGAAGDDFGVSVSLSGNTVVVGADDATVGGNIDQGAAYVFETSAASPVVTAIAPSSGPTTGGTTVTIAGTGFSGTTAVDFGGTAATGVAINSAGTQITATSPAGTGTVDVTVTGPGGVSTTSSANQFTYVVAPATKLTASDGAASDYLGSSLSISGNTMVVGSPNATVGSNIYQGAVYVFREFGGAWTETAKLTASDGAAGAFFGKSVSIDGNTVVVGAYGAKSGQGAAYVFTEPASGWANMTENRQAHCVRWRCGRVFRLVGIDQRQPAGRRSGRRHGRHQQRPGCGLRVRGVRDGLDPGRQAHRVGRRGGRPFRRLGLDQRQHGGGRSVRRHGRHERQPGGGLRLHRARFRLGEHGPDGQAHCVRRRGGRQFRLLGIDQRQHGGGRSGRGRQPPGGSLCVHRAWFRLGEHDPDCQAHRVGRRGGRPFRRLGFAQRRLAGGRRNVDHGRRQHRPGGGLPVQRTWLRLGGHDPEHQAHRVRWRGGRLFRLLGFAQRQHGAGRIAVRPGRQQQGPGGGLRVWNRGGQPGRL